MVIEGGICMVAYFKFQNNVLMAVGAAAGLLTALFCYDGFIRPQADYSRAFFVAIAIFAGIVCGRILSAVMAKRRLAKMDELLYRKLQPAWFLEKFGDILRRVPKTTVEYVDGMNKMAYAHEALGNFEEGLALLEDLRPEELKLHALAAGAVTANQRARLYLLLEEPERAEGELERLRELKDMADHRAPQLSKNLGECIRLGENWLRVIRGEEADEDYLEEEIKLARNIIHKNEIRLVLAKARLGQGKRAGAVELLREICEEGGGLYVGRVAERWLGEIG